MERITLTSEQLRVVEQSRDAIAVHDEDGNLRGYIAMIVTDAELADARKALASSGPRYTTAEVLARLRSLATP